MITLGVNEVDRYVSKLQRKGVAVRWDGWNMIFFNKDQRAVRHPAGRRLGNEWGFETVVSPNSNGVWVLNHSLVRAKNG